MSSTMLLIFLGGMLLQGSAIFAIAYFAARLAIRHERRASN
jgi:hypothetical protein